jgi:hypothetical protein
MSKKSSLEDADASRGGVVRATPRRQIAPIKDSRVLVNLNARVPEPLWRRLRMECAVDGRFIQTFIAEAIEEQLDPTKRGDT